MLLFLKKKPEDETPQAKAPAGGLPYDAKDFIPYSCHYDAGTILTKNGELLQIIKISGDREGRNYESDDAVTVRDALRRAVTANVTSRKFSLWIHTLRKSRPIAHESRFAEKFASYAQERWEKEHPWKRQFYNEVYISILHDGQSGALFDKNALKHVLLPRRNRDYRNRFLDAAAAELRSVTAAITADIAQHYDAKILGLSERQPHMFYSEPMEFLSTLVNLHEQPFPVSETDISTQLSTRTLTIGFNAVEVKQENGARNFGALMSLKRYCEMPSAAVDQLLQAPVELIVSESFCFAPAAQVLRQYREQKSLFDISGDAWSAKVSGLDEMLKSDQKKPTDFGRHQMSIMILADEFKELEPQTQKVHAVLGTLGLIAIREDLRLEDCFWAQLPGNFEFLRRRQPVNTARIGGLARLNLFPGGQAEGNHWGPAVAMIPTSVRSPYFFNFHHQDNGHTLMLDFNSFNDRAGSVLLHFLLTMSRRYGARTFIFDRRRCARLLFDKLGGSYHRFSGARKLGLNPFALDDSPRNRSFLLAWCLALAGSQGQAQRETLQAALAELYDLAPQKRDLPALAARLTLKDPALAAAFTAYTNGARKGFLDAGVDTLDLTRGNLHAFDLDEAAVAGAAMPLFSYLLHRIIATLDGTPTIIAVHDAWSVIDNPFFAPRLESLLAMLKQNNAMMIFSTGNPAAAAATEIFSTLRPLCATQLVVPSDIRQDYAAMPGLDARDERLLMKMERQKGDFLVKQAGESIALSVDLAHMDDLHAIFDNNIKNLMAAGGPFASLPKEG